METSPHGIELHDDPILLRAWREEDAAAVYLACQDPEMQRWLPVLPRPFTDEDARAIVSGAHGFGRYQFAVCEHGTVVGSVGLRPAEHETGDIGYWCAPEARGRGITTRALRRFCLHALDELHLERLELITDSANAASQRVAVKVGFQREGVKRSHLRHPDGQRRDSVLFSLLPGELR